MSDQTTRVGDITDIRLDSEFVYLAVLMDVFTRSIRGWQLGRSLEANLTIVALNRAFVGSKPKIHHTDQGMQYAAKADTQLLKNQGVAISRAEIGEPTQNGYAPAVDAND